MKYLDALIDDTTMYRLVLYTLAWLWGVSVLLATLGILHQKPLALVIGLGVLLFGCVVANYILAWIYKVPANIESSLITALILFFVLLPPLDGGEYVALGLAAGIAMVSKYAITWRGAHIFNPAAFAACVVSILGLSTAGWWVANQAMVIPVLIVALLVLKKLRRFTVFAAFAAPATMLLMFNHVNLAMIITSFPLLFLGSIMLTEPATMPGKKNDQLIFAAIVGLIFGAELQLFSGLSTSPHLALLAGNVFAFVIAMRSSTLATLVEKIQLSPTTYEFAFRPQRKLAFSPGQYAEMTLAGVPYDSRGNRRSFTLASSPHDELIRFGVKFYPKSSTYKQALGSLEQDASVLINHVAGNFTLPGGDEPIIMLAGGVGITPFISQLRALHDEAGHHITLHHFIADQQEKIYSDELMSARQRGVNVQYHIGIDDTISDQYILDNKDSAWYISGPPPMVRAYTKRLRAGGVKKIKRDYFSGY